MLVKNKYKIIYCSNIFKEDSWDELFLKLNDYVIFLDEKNIEISLCFSSELVKGFLKNKKDFKEWLNKKKVFISSINGFVYTKFHREFIKDNIYYPDWTTSERLAYTIDLILILDDLLPKNKSGSISTLPLSYSPWIKKKHIDYIFYKSSKNLINLYSFLLKFENKRRFIHIDIEPEPTCLIDNIDNFIKYFNDWLVPINQDFFLKNHSINENKSVSILRRYFRLCYDISHSSVNFDDHSKNIAKLEKNKIKIGKVQISSAKEFLISDNGLSFSGFLERINDIKNSPFLHQLAEKKNGKIIIYRDLIDFLNTGKEKKNIDIRIHFHMPIFEDKFTTQYDTKKALYLLFNCKYIKHFEIETYTFSSLSKEEQFNFMSKEYKWLKNFIKSELCLI